MKTLEIGFFVLCALFVLGGAAVTISSRKPVRCAMGLLATILGIAGCYLLLTAEFLAAIQIIVYAGAVVILFIFVVMLLGPGATDPRELGKALPRYVSALVFLLASAGALALVLQLAKKVHTEMPAAPDGFGSIEAVGKEIFTVKIIPFELTGALLLVAVVGALAVARGKQKDPTRPAPASKALPSSQDDEPRALPPAGGDESSSPETAS